MDFDPDIAKLESSVDRLLDKYNVLKKECEQLTLELAESQAQLSGLLEEKNILLNEKDTVHSKVTSILGKLSAWEDSLSDDSEVSNAETSPEQGGQLFSMGSSS